MTNKLRVIIYLLFLIPYPLSLVGQSKVDSLYSVLKTENEDTNKVRTLNVLCKVLYKKTEFVKADSMVKLALAISEKLDYNYGRIISYANIGYCYDNQGKFNDALQSHLQSVKLAEEIDDEKDMASEYTAIGNVYYVLGNNPEALKYFLKNLDLDQKTGDKANMSNSYVGVANVYQVQGNYEEALKNDLKGLEINKELGNKASMSIVYDNIGDVYNAMHEYSKALENFSLSLQMAESMNYGYVIGNACLNMGSTYVILKNYPEALKNFFRALTTFEKIKNTIGMSGAYNGIGNLYIIEKKYPLAKEYIDSTLNLSLKINSKEAIRDAYNTYAMWDSATGNYSQALINYKLFIAYRDSLKSEESTRKIVSEQMNYEFEKKLDADKAEQIRKDAIDSEDRKKQAVIRNLFIAGFVLMLLLAFFIFRGYRQKQKVNELILKQKEEVDRLSIVARETDNLILIMGADGKVEWGNESFTKFNGITVEDLKKIKGETIFDISNNPRIRDIVNTAVKERRSVVYESLNENKQGSRIWESSTLTPIFDETGKLHKIIIVDTDITERKNAEEIIQQKNKDITDSIHYASRIQKALLTTDEYISQSVPEHFILFKPRDIVSGDFYWAIKSPGTGQFFIACCDCTGHGVPGAFMSLLNISMLNQAVIERKINRPDLILNDIRTNIIRALNPDGSDKSKDGMDCSLIAIDGDRRLLKVASANNPVWIIKKDKTLVEIEPDKMPVGIQYGEQKPFSLKEIEIEKGDTIYMFTDGYADQFGGPKGKKFKYKHLQQLVAENAQLTMAEQKEILEKKFNEWKGNLEQIDDVLIIGIRV